MFLKAKVKSFLQNMGYKITRVSPDDDRGPIEFTAEELDIAEHIISNKLTLVSLERLWTTLLACKYALDHGTDGDFVECGVWRGGDAIAAASIFKLYGSTKKVWLFDTFSGMTEPTKDDVGLIDNRPAHNEFIAQQKESHNEWCYASLSDVKRNFKDRGLLNDNVIFVEGDVVETLSIPSNIPERICLLRLDTDWYESTKKELEVLYPLLSIGGSLLIDDYGHWAGSKKAVDEYFAVHGGRPFFHFTDSVGRAGVKIN